MKWDYRIYLTGLFYKENEISEEPREVNTQELSAR